MPGQNGHSESPASAPDIFEPGADESRVIESLQRQLVDERDKRGEERFVWFAGVNILVDLFVFPSLQTWSAPIAISVIQVLILIVVVRKWGIDDIWTLTEKLLDKWDGRAS